MNAHRRARLPTVLFAATLSVACGREDIQLLAALDASTSHGGAPDATTPADGAISEAAAPEDAGPPSAARHRLASRTASAAAPRPTVARGAAKTRSV